MVKCGRQFSLDRALRTTLCVNGSGSEVEALGSQAHAGVRVGCCTWLQIRGVGGWDAGPPRRSHPRWACPSTIGWEQQQRNSTSCQGWQPWLVGRGLCYLSQ